MEWKFSTEVISVALASIGGLAKYLHNYILGDKFAISILIANVIVSGFAGFMAAQLSDALGASIKMQFVFAGIGGFMGAAAIEFIKAFMVDKFHLDFKKADPK